MWSRPTIHQVYVVKTEQEREPAMTRILKSIANWFNRPLTAEERRVLRAWNA